MQFCFWLLCEMRKCRGINFNYFRCEYGRVRSTDLSRPARQNRTADHWHAHQEDYEPWWVNQYRYLSREWSKCKNLRQFIWEVLKYGFAYPDPTSIRECLTRNIMAFFRVEEPDPSDPIMSYCRIWAVLNNYLLNFVNLYFKVGGVPDPWHFGMDPDP
jgi:hypothetical protein